MSEMSIFCLFEVKPRFGELRGYSSLFNVHGFAHGFALSHSYISRDFEYTLFFTRNQFIRNWNCQIGRKIRTALGFNFSGKKLIYVIRAVFSDLSHLSRFSANFGGNQKLLRNFFDPIICRSTRGLRFLAKKYNFSQAIINYEKTYETFDAA